MAIIDTKATSIAPTLMETIRIYFGHRPFRLPRIRENITKSPNITTKNRCPMWMFANRSSGNISPWQRGQSAQANVAPLVVTIDPDISRAYMAAAEARINKGSESFCSPRPLEKAPSRGPRKAHTVSKIRHASRASPTAR